MKKLGAKYFLLLLILMFYTVDMVKAEDITLSSNGSDQEQDSINEALKTVFDSGGGTVYLKEDEYLIKGPVRIGSNTELTGDPDAIIRVPPDSSQWYKDGTGLIDQLSSELENVSIHGFQIDGNLDELPKSHANSGSGIHNAQRGIDLRGSTNSFLKNISIYDMEIYDCYSDGVHVALAENVQSSNNFVSNCQHSGIYYVSVVNGLIEDNKVAGITSDCVRQDNCVDNIVRDNLLYSYTGDNSNGAYQEGQNSLQIADQGYSHGGGSDKPTSTENIEVYNNTFVNTGLRSIWLDSTGKGTENVYIHDNNFIDGSKIETSGISVKDISFDNTPSTQLSEEIFDTIFDILNIEFSEDAKTEYSADDFDYEVKETEKGKIAGAIKIVGWNNLCKIENVSYVSSADDIIVKTSVIKNPSLDAWYGGISKINKTVSVKIDNSTAIATLNVSVKWYNFERDKKTGARVKGKMHYSNYTFTDSCSAPQILQGPEEVKGIIYQYPTFFKVNVAYKGLTKVKYDYDGSLSEHIYLVGVLETDENNMKFTNYSKLEHWEGNIKHEGDWLHVIGEFDKNKLKVTASTPYQEITDINFKIVKKDTPEQIIAWWLYPSLGLIFLILFLAKHKWDEFKYL